MFSGCSGRYGHSGWEDIICGDCFLKQMCFFTYDLGSGVAVRGTGQAVHILVTGSLCTSQRSPTFLVENKCQIATQVTYCMFMSREQFNLKVNFHFQIVLFEQLVTITCEEVELSINARQKAKIRGIFEKLNLISDIDLFSAFLSH